MKIISKLIFIAALLSSPVALKAQDVRTLETKVADLLAKMPANDPEQTSVLMEEMYSLGDQGTSLICQQVVQAGTGDDTRARYAVSSLSSHLSGGSDEKRKALWEQQCLRFMKGAEGYEVRLFFMRQLNLIGSDAAVDDLVPWVTHEVICNDAVMALQAIGTEKARQMLASTLQETVCPCASQIMNTLAAVNYSPAIGDYINWYEKGNSAEKCAALSAMANSGSNEALPVLMKAAENAGYQWEPTGAVSALLLYAKHEGLAGEGRTMDKITRLIMSESNTEGTAGQRLAAMSVLVSVEGEDALSMLLDAADDPDVDIRGGVMRLAGMIPGEEATKKWITRYSKVRPEAKPEILFMLGERGDVLAIPLLHKALENPSSDISSEAAAALARVEGIRAVDPLLAWILKFDDEEDHWAAVNALRTILDKNNIGKVAASLPVSRGHATVTLLWLLGWSGDQGYFKTIVPYVESDDIGVRAAALMTLKNVAGYGDQETLIAMLEKSAERPEITELGNAIIAAAMRSNDTTVWSDVIISALDRGADRQKLIPLLAVTGGKKALLRVAKEFENGSAETRDACFDALSHWSDPSATSVLLDICASGNKTFERPAFDAYLRMVSSADITPGRKILLIEEIAPLAHAPDARIEMIEQAASLGIFPARDFISEYLADSSEEVRAAAEKAVAGMNLPETDDLVYNLSPEEKAEGFVSLFNGRNLDGWVGDTVSYNVENGTIIIKPGKGPGGNLYTEDEYADFVFRFEFQLTPGANNGLGIRTPLTGDAAYVGMELQILDNTASIYANLHEYQYHGSVYGVIPAKRGYLKPVGEWNSEEVIVRGTKVKIILNGNIIVDGDVAEDSAGGTPDGAEHPGLKNKSGHIGFLGHGSLVTFRNIRINELD